MRIINISDSKKRNTRVELAARRQPPRFKQVTKDKQEVVGVRLIRGSPATDLSSLTAETSLEDLSQQLIDGDPELDLELFGKRIEETHRVYLDPDDKPVYGVTLKQRIYGSDGEMKEEREFKVAEANINDESPIRWSGRLMPKAQAYRKFAFTRCQQLQHVDGLTFDFLYEMAKELEDKKSLLLVASGKKSNQPLILTRNGSAYRGFLEGRTKGDKYMLLLHLTNLELKPLPKEEA